MRSSLVIAVNGGTISNEELFFRDLILNSNQNIPNILSQYINSIGNLKRPSGKMYFVDRLEYQYHDFAGLVGLFFDKINKNNWLPYRMYPRMVIKAYRI